MKKHLRKIAYSFLVFAILFTTIIVVDSEIVYAVDEKESLSEIKSFDNDEDNDENEEETEVEIEQTPSAEKNNNEDSEHLNNLTEEVQNLEEIENNKSTEKEKQVTSPSLLENKEGWIQENNKTFYYVNNKKVTGFKTIDEKKHYFDEAGNLQKNAIIQLNNKTFRTNELGELITGWYKDANTDWYYYAVYTGEMQLGWQKINEKWYYLESNGVMAIGWKNLNDYWYYLYPSGAMATGWEKINNIWFFLRNNGSMVDTTYKTKDRIHAFAKSGAWQGSWRENSIGRWFMKENNEWSKEEWMYLNNNWYYFDHSGYMMTGWQKVDNDWYYLNSNGSMLTGWQKINNKWYYLNSNGSMATGWKKINNDWYYLHSNGSMSTGWQKVNGIWYYLHASGSMATDWQKINNQWYYLDSNGNMTIGWKELNNKWYYLHSNGSMSTGWQKVNGIWYYLHASGSMATDWQKINNQWYYLNSNGSMATGWKKSKNKWYYLNSNGHMAVNTVIGKYKIDGNGVWVNFTVYLDAGHGGKDPGANFHGLKEKVLTLDTTLKLKKELEKRGYNVLMSRDSDVFVELYDIALKANVQKADIFVSVHYNSMGGIGTAKGIETFIHHTVASGFGQETNRNNFNTNDPRIKNSLKLADVVHNNVIRTTNMYNRGVKGNNFSVLRNTKMPAILVELGFIDNKLEANVVKTSSYQEKATNGIAEGIDNYFK